METVIITRQMAMHGLAWLLHLKDDVRGHLKLMLHHGMASRLAYAKTKVR